MLTEKIIKPLIKIYLSGQEAKWDKLSEAKPGNKCQKCDKQFTSPSGLKMHVTKMHNKKQKETAESLVNENNTLNL